MRLCKSKLVTKLILLAVIIGAIATIASLQPKIDTYNQTSSALSQEIDRLTQENLALQDNIRELGSDEGAIHVAHERLGLVFDDEVLYKDLGE